jgi:hypothetical protein
VTFTSQRLYHLGGPRVGLDAGPTFGWGEGALAPGADFEGAPKRQSPTGHTLIRSIVSW